MLYNYPKKGPNIEFISKDHYFYQEVKYNAAIGVINKYTSAFDETQQIFSFFTTVFDRDNILLSQKKQVS